MDALNFCHIHLTL